MLAPWWRQLHATAMFACLLAGGAVARASGDDGAAQPPAARSVTPVLVYDGDVFANARGGARRGVGYEGLLHAQLSIDGERLSGWQETSANLTTLVIHGGQPGALSADAQGISNIQAAPGVKLEEAWIQRNFLDGRISVLAGRYDLNSEFYRLNSAGLFLNSSFGIGPEFSQSGIAGPSIFPSTSIGVRLAIKPAPNLIVRAAVLDGAPVGHAGEARGPSRSGDGLLLVSEVAWLTRPAPVEQRPNHRFRIGRGSGLAPYEDKIAIGSWHYTASFNDLSDVDGYGRPVRRKGSSGIYFLVDRLVYRTLAHPEQKLAVFAQLGLGDRRVNRFDAYFGAGFVASGLVPGHAADELGLAFAMARNGNHYMLGQQQQGIAAQRAETTLELTYLSQINPSLSVQPNLQYVIHPGTTPTVSNALTFQLRAEIAF
jgi:porin